MALSLVTAPTVEPLTIAEVKAQLRLGSTSGEPAPIAPTIALAGSGSGSVTNGAHRVAVTFVTADGETELGTASSSVTVVDNSTNGKIAVTGIPLGGAAVTARKLYMTAAGGSTYLLQSTIANNTATTETINTADASLGAQAPTTNTTADPELTRLISTARQHVENYLERKLLNQTWDLKLLGFPCGELVLPFSPVSSITSITYLDGNGDSQTWSSGDYQTDLPAGPWAAPARIAPGYGKVYPTTRHSVYNAVTVRFVAGYGAAASSVPKPILDAMLLLISHWFEHREAVNVGNIVSEMPEGVAALLWPFKLFPQTVSS